MKVRRVVPHPAYNVGVAHDNDVALFQLSSRVTFHEHLLPVCLPPANRELVPGTVCTVIGWGKKEDTGSKICAARRYRCLLLCFKMSRSVWIRTGSERSRSSRSESRSLQLLAGKQRFKCNRRNDMCWLQGRWQGRLSGEWSKQMLTFLIRTGIYLIKSRQTVFICKLRRSANVIIYSNPVDGKYSIYRISVWGRQIRD